VREPNFAFGIKRVGSGSIQTAGKRQHALARVARTRCKYCIMFASGTRGTHQLHADSRRDVQTSAGAECAGQTSIDCARSSSLLLCR
jgi:hypothetical protein